MHTKQSGWQMCKRQQIHATLIECEGRGVLIRGSGGLGKSDLALRLIERKNARLVADDVVWLALENGKIFGSAPEILKGLLEVRGIGIVKYPYAEKVQVQLVVDLLKTAEEVERMPKNAHENILGVEIAKIDLYAKESSAPEKVLLKLNGNIVNDASI